MKTTDPAFPEPPADAGTTPPPGFKPQDPGRIHAADPVELRYWCRELRCSEDALRQAIAEAGDHVTEVRKRLERTH